MRNARVQILQPSGEFVGEWKSEALGRPWAVDVAPDGTFFVLDGGDQPESGPDRAKVVRVDEDGEILETFGRAGDGPGELDRPHDLVVSGAGEVFVGEVHFWCARPEVRARARELNGTGCRNQKRG